jgi:hypothetical protein
MNGTPSTTRRLLHVGSIISNRIAVPTPIPSSNADILPNNITGSCYFYSFSTAPMSWVGCALHTDALKFYQNLIHKCTPYGGRWTTLIIPSFGVCKAGIAIIDSAEKPHVLDSLSGTGAVVNLKI